MRSRERSKTKTRELEEVPLGVGMQREGQMSYRLILWSNVRKECE